MAKYKVKFKENYMPRAVERTCDVSSKDEIIRIYNLNDDDIEWYEITEIEA